MQITTIGPDIAKSVFQVHGVDAAGLVVVRRQLKRFREAATLPNRHRGLRLIAPFLGPPKMSDLSGQRRGKADLD